MMPVAKRAYRSPNQRIEQTRIERAVDWARNDAQLMRILLCRAAWRGRTEAVMEYELGVVRSMWCRHV